MATMGRLKITDVSEENWRAVANLAVAPGQEGLIESNTQSLLEAAMILLWAGGRWHCGKRIIWWALR